MAAYVVQRLGAVMVIIVAMSILVFLATHALPSNTAALTTPDLMVYPWYHSTGSWNNTQG
jgi:hypothetical protein